MSGGWAAVSSLESPTAKGALAAGSGVSPGQAAFPPGCKSQVEEMRACGKKKGKQKVGTPPGGRVREHWVLFFLRILQAGGLGQVLGEISTEYSSDSRRALSGSSLQ